MSKVIGVVVGGTPKELEANTVGDVRAQLNATGYLAKVNGETAEDSRLVLPFEYISFSAQVKGAVCVGKGKLAGKGKGKPTKK